MKSIGYYIFAGGMVVLFIYFLLLWKGNDALWTEWQQGLFSGVIISVVFYLIDYLLERNN